MMNTHKMSNFHQFLQYLIKIVRESEALDLIDFVA